MPSETQQSKQLLGDESLRKLLELLTEAHQAEPALLLHVSDVQRLLGRSKARVYEMCATGELECIRDGRSVLIPRQALDEWIKRKRRTGGGR